MNNVEELAQDRSWWRKLVVSASKSLVEANKEERKKGNKSYIEIGTLQVRIL